MIYETIHVNEYKVEVLEQGCCYRWHITGKGVDKVSGGVYGDPELCLSEGVRFVKERLIDGGD
jgi:hypothetical protein